MDVRGDVEPRAAGNQDALFDLARRAQLLAGAMARHKPVMFWLRDAWNLLETIPKPLDISEQRVVAHIVSGTALRFNSYPLEEFRRTDTTNARIKTLRCAMALACIRRFCLQPNISLDWLAGLTGLSPCYVSRLLSDESGSGFAEHVRNMRLLRAIVLVGDLRLSQKQVAAAAGLASTGELDRIFGRVLGFTPSRLREFLVNDDPV